MAISACASCGWEAAAHLERCPRCRKSRRVQGALVPVAVAAGGNQTYPSSPPADGRYPYTFDPGAPVGAAYPPPGTSYQPAPPAKRSAGLVRGLVIAGTAVAVTAGTVFASGAAAAVVVDEAVVHEVAAAFDTAVAVMQGWDSSFEEPGLKYYDDEDDIAYYYFGKVHIDPGTLQECDQAGCTTTTRDVHYTVAHELGHAWEDHLGTYADSAAGQEDFAECIAGAVGAEAGWDVYAMADYTWGLVDDETHGTGDHRYDVLLAGADYGHEYCEATYLT